MCLIELFYTDSPTRPAFSLAALTAHVRYVRAYRDLTCPIEEIVVYLPPCDKANVGQRHCPDGMWLQSTIMNRRQSVLIDRVYTPWCSFERENKSSN